MSSERKRLVNRLDKVFSIYIRNRDGRCVTCGKKEALQCGHLFSRIAYSTRWDEMNAYCQCAGCNIQHERNFWPLYRYAIQIHGEEKIEQLQRKYKTPVKLSNEVLMALIDKYKEE